MADGYISQIKTPDNKVYDFRDQHLKVYTGSCTTAAGTAIKDVTTDGEFTLAKGAVIFVNFSTTNTAAVADLKLRVNSNAVNDAKPIKHEYNASEANLPGAGYLRANQTYQFYYDGTNWVTDVGRDANSTYSYMRPYENTGKGSYNSQGENPVKTGAAGWRFQLSAGKYFMYSHYYDNTAKSALTLNIGSTGAKPIYINGQPSSADNYTLPGGQYLVYYDGTNYYFRTDDKMTGNITGNAATASSIALSGVTGADDLKAIEAISGTTGLLKKTAANTWTLDTNTYLTTHRTYTAVSGKKPTGNQTPGFGSTFDIEQVGQDTTGQVSVTERTVKIPDTAASASVAGLVNTDAQIFGGIKTFMNGIEIKGHIAGDSSTTTGHGLYGGGMYHNAYNNIILHGDASTGSSGIAFVSDKVAANGTITNRNAPSDRAFIQYHACGVTTATAEGTNPTLASGSEEAGRLVIGIGNDSGDRIILQAPGTTDIIHQIGANGYPIPHTTNTNGSVGGTTTPVYVDAGIIKAGTALKDLAYISKGSGTTKFLREDGTWQTVLTAHQSLAAYAPLASPALTGTPTAPTAANGTSTTQIATTEFVNNTLSYVNAMRFKGTLGTGGTVTALPASHETGDTYRVITAGTWAGEYCETGTLIICTTDGTAANDAHWACVGTNEDGTVIGPESSTDNAIARFDGATGRIIQDSGITINDNGNLVIAHATNATMTTASTNPQIIFSENGSQPVHLIYSDVDSYRSPAGLKIIGGTSASPAWLEAEGDIYAEKYHGSIVPSTWVAGQRYQNGAYNINNYSNTSSYNPWMRATNTWASGTEDEKVGRWFSFGTLGTSFYLMGSVSTRTANGFDHALRYDTSSGKLYCDSVEVSLNGHTHNESSITWSNATLYLIGDDIYIGDINQAGHLGLKSRQAGNTGLAFIKQATAGDTTISAPSGTSMGKITWDGIKFSITSTTAVDASISGNAATATTATNLSADPTIVSGGTATVNLAANTAYTLTVGGKSIIFKTPADNNTATAVDNILDGSNSGTAITYAPYTTRQTDLTFDTAAAKPTGTDRLNLNGNFHATNLYGDTAVINEQVTLQWNNSDQALEFVFV